MVIHTGLNMNTRTWKDGVEVFEPDSGYVDDNITLWKECRIGFLPQQCNYSGQMLWPFTKAAQRCLIHISDKAMYSKRFYANTKDATFANLKMKR